ncbi:ATP-dependent HslUV protease ATP-binding subunit HslU [Planctomycetales bacterium 10988]|nr:ATP-dependent HslUV protease ATP-binding subunit HslU [Planctomycetales bacterium 10988]
MRDLTPRQIVEELDRYIVGQAEAKRAVAIAVRNRWRRQQLSEDLRNEISPKNILMMGPTGVGKTEIARRLAQLTDAPFLKVEATKFTEVGYYGRDVESIVRELVDSAVALIKGREGKRVEKAAREKVNERLLNILLRTESDDTPLGSTEEERERTQRTREKFAKMLDEGSLENRMIEISISQKVSPMVLGNMGLENVDQNLQEMMEKLLPRETRQRTLPVSEARKVLLEEERDRLINEDQVHESAVSLAENAGVVFLDEIDKIIPSDSNRNADVSRQGVQRDLLPIVEGTTVQTKYGYVKTDHILFIAAGAFHQTKPSELMPELQGRFPIRVELTDLTTEDFIQILAEPKNALTKQYKALFQTEEIELQFTQDGIEAMAHIAFLVNQKTQNIGARRLHTILERLLEELNFEAPTMKTKEVKIDAEYVSERLQEIAEDEDLSRYIL